MKKTKQVIFLFDDGSMKGYNWNAFKKVIQTELKERLSLIKIDVDIKKIYYEEGIDYMG